MIRSIAFVAFCAFAAPSACAHQPPAPTPVRVICTVGTPWTPEMCWVEFGSPVTGPRVQVADRADGEELVALLLSNPGAVYVFDDGLTPAKSSQPAHRVRERVDMVWSRTAP